MTDGIGINCDSSQLKSMVFLSVQDRAVSVKRRETELSESEESRNALEEGTAGATLNGSLAALKSLGNQVRRVLESPFEN